MGCKTAVRIGKKGQIFSLDVMVAFFVLIMIFTTSIWLWNTAREKLYLAESRNNLELVARNAIYTLLQTVGDPPNWHQLSVKNETTVKSLGIGKNRPWFIDEDKSKILESMNATNYTMIKKILTIRGNEFFLNISKYNATSSQFEKIAYVGKKPTKDAEQVVRIDRIGLSDKDKSWTKIIIYVWKKCRGGYC